MLGSQRDGGSGGGGTEWRRAVVMSHLLRADRMATESWHVPHSHEEGEDVEETKCVGKKKKILYQSTHLFVRDVHLYYMRLIQKVTATGLRLAQLI